MEESKICNNFLQDIVNIATPFRITLEIKLVRKKSKLNLRTKNKKEDSTWKLISFDAKYKLISRLLEEFLLNDDLFEKIIKRIEIICFKNAITTSEPEVFTSKHYLFGQTIYICIPDNKEQMSYVNISDLQFNTKNLENTRAFLCDKYFKQGRKLSISWNSSDLPF